MSKPVRPARAGSAFFSHRSLHLKSRRPASRGFPVTHGAPADASHTRLWDVITVRGGVCPESRKMSKKVKKRRKNALVVCRDGKRFWTTQKQFWQWLREGVVVKTGDVPLAGLFVRDHEELLIVLSNTVLNLACPNHLRESLQSRRVARLRK